MSAEPTPEGLGASAELQGRVALIGGGSKGIGRAAALRLAAAGCDVAIVAREEGPCRAVAAEIEAMGRRALALTADLADVGDTRNMVESTIRAFGGVDILVVSGGNGPPVDALPFAETDPVTFPDYFVGQLLTRLNAIGAVLPTMRERGYGKIVLVTSDAGRVPTPGEALFGAACAGLQYAVRSIGREVARFGVRLNAVSITVTRDTGTWEGYLVGDTPGDILMKVFSKIEEKTPFRLNSPDDVAAAAYFLSSPASDQITGATISVNGGLSFP